VHKRLEVKQYLVKVRAVGLPRVARGATAALGLPAAALGRFKIFFYFEACVHESIRVNYSSSSKSRSSNRCGCGCSSCIHRTCAPSETRYLYTYIYIYIYTHTHT